MQSARGKQREGSREWKKKGGQNKTKVWQKNIQLVLFFTIPPMGTPLGIYELIMVLCRQIAVKREDQEDHWHFRKSKQ